MLLILACTNNSDKAIQSKVDIELVGPLDDLEINKTITEFDKDGLLKMIQEDSVFRYKIRAPFYFFNINLIENPMPRN